MTKINNTFLDRSSLVGEWLLDGDAKDTAGTNNGTATNVSWISADRGYVAEVGSFNGTSSYVNFGTNNLLPSGTTRHFSFWVNPSVLSGGDTFSATNPRTIFYGDDGSNVGFFIRFLGQKINVGGAVSSTIYEAITGIILSISVWQKIDVIISPNTKVKIYLNNILQTNITDNTVPSNWNNSTNSNLIGKQSTVRYFNGTIGLARIFNTALSQKEITALYLEGLRKFGPTNLLNRSQGFPKYSLPNLEVGKILEISKPVNGGVYYDQTGSGNNGTNNGVTDSTVGLNNVMSFNGNSYISNIPVLPNSGASFFTTIKQDTTVTQYYFNSRETLANADNRFIFYYTSGVIRILNTNGGTQLFFDYTINPTGKEYRIGFTHDGINTATLYINGIAVSNGNIGAISGTLISSLTTIGARADNMVWYDGTMKNIFMYNKALSDIEIQQDYYSNKII